MFTPDYIVMKAPSRRHFPRAVFLPDSVHQCQFAVPAYSAGRREPPDLTTLIFDWPNCATTNRFKGSRQWSEAKKLLAGIGFFDDTFFDGLVAV